MKLKSRKLKFSKKRLRRVIRPESVQQVGAGVVIDVSAVSFAGTNPEYYAQKSRVEINLKMHCIELDYNVQRISSARFLH